MARFWRIVQAVREFISWLNLPFDVQALWNFFRRWILPPLSASLSSAVVIVLGRLQDAPFWQIALLAILAFAVIYILVFILARAARSRTPSVAPTPPPQRDSAATIAEEAATEANRTTQEVVGDSGDEPRQPARRGLEELKALCRRVADDLTAFDHERRGVSGDATDEDTRCRDEETMRLYHEQHKPRIMDLYNELAPRGWFYKGDQEQFENVSDWGDLQFAAERLRAICRSFAGD